MALKEPTGLLIWGWAGAVAAVLQLIGLIRYLDRDLDDWIGVALFAVVAFLYAITSVIAFIRWGRLSH